MKREEDRPIRSVKDLDREPYLAFQRRSWRVQRAGWIVTCLVLLAGLLGLLGPGPLSDAVAGGDGLRLQYERFVHVDAPAVLRADLDLRAGAPADVQLALDRGFVAGVDIERVVPQPDVVELEPDALVYRFRRGGAGAGVGSVVFHLRHEKAGSRRGVLELRGGPAVRFRQFVYP
jgi:hypothetical protein